MTSFNLLNLIYSDWLYIRLPTKKTVRKKSEVVYITNIIKSNTENRLVWLEGDFKQNFKDDIA